MQRVCVGAVLTLLLLTAGCLEPGGESERLEGPHGGFRDRLMSEDGVSIEETKTGRVYRFSFGEDFPYWGNLYGFLIVPLEDVEVSAHWSVSFDSSREYDECSMFSLDAMRFGAHEAGLPSLGSVHWTSTERVRAGAGAGVGLQVDLGSTGEAEPLESSGAGDWPMEYGEELFVSFGSTARLDHPSRPRHHELELVVEVVGDSVVTNHSLGDEKRWFECGSGSEGARRTAWAGVGPVYAVEGARAGFGSDEGASLVWHYAEELPPGRAIVRFLDETFDSPQEVVRTSGEGGLVEVSFSRWWERDGAKVSWWMSSGYHPWVERGEFDGQVFSSGWDAGEVAE